MQIWRPILQSTTCFKKATTTRVSYIFHWLLLLLLVSKLDLLLKSYEYPNFYHLWPNLRVFSKISSPTKNSEKVFEHNILALNSANRFLRFFKKTFDKRSRLYSKLKLLYPVLIHFNCISRLNAVNFSRCQIFSQSAQ